MKVVLVSAVTAALVASLAAAGISVAVLRPELLGIATTGWPAPETQEDPVIAGSGQPSLMRAGAAAGESAEGGTASLAAEAPPDPAADTDDVSGRTSFEPAPLHTPSEDREAEQAATDPADAQVEMAATVVVPELPRLMTPPASAASPAPPVSDDRDADMQPDGETGAAPAETGPSEPDDPPAAAPLDRTGGNGPDASDAPEALPDALPDALSVATFDPVPAEAAAPAETAALDPATGPPRLEGPDELVLAPGVPAVLPLQVAGAREDIAGHSVLLVGFTRGARLSRGTSLMFDTWQVPARDLYGAELTLRDGLAREIPVEIELRRPDGLARDRRTLVLKTPGSPSALGLTEADFRQAAAATGAASNARALTLRAERLIDNGDPLSARIPLARAADEGSPLAAWMLALSYDPDAAARLGVPPDATDAARARGYYERAAALGLEPR